MRKQLINRKTEFIFEAFNFYVVNLEIKMETIINPAFLFDFLSFEQFDFLLFKQFDSLFEKIDFLSFEEVDFLLFKQFDSFT